MKKIPLYLIIMVPLMIAVAVFGIIFGVKLIGVNQIYTLKSFQLDEVEDIPAAKKVTTYSVEKNQKEYENVSAGINSNKVVATYQYDNITFVSVSEEWGYDGLKEICEELLLNKHGDEMKELDYVLVYDGLENPYLDDELLGGNLCHIPMRLYSFIPDNYSCAVYEYSNFFKLYHGDYYNKIEYMATRISEGYGMYFMDYYFNTNSTDSEKSSSEYFKLRYQNNPDILYKSSSYNVSDATYNSTYIWYLDRIAAYDYVYLLGSPTVKTNYEYMDTLELLRLSHADEDEILSDYYYYIRRTNTFNEIPVLNAALPMPDQVNGLPELLFSQIGMNAPDYKDRQEKVDDIDLKISKQSEYGKKFYVATWDKPWEYEDVTYTLVAYEETDKVYSAVKSIDSSERARVIFGGAVYKYNSRSVTFLDSDDFKDQGFLRFRVVVTFGDGTAVMSSAIDWSFE